MLASSLQTVVQTGDNTQSPGIPGMVLFNFASREKFIVTILRNMMPLFASYLTGDRSGTITPSNFKNQNEIVTFCSRSACEHVTVNIFEFTWTALKYTALLSETGEEKNNGSGLRGKHVFHWFLYLPVLYLWVYLFQMKEGQAECARHQLVCRL